MLHALVTIATLIGGTPETYETVVSAEAAPDDPVLPSWRATTQITREQLERRLPRSTPEALLYEPGVFVQQTGHAQASAFVRGLTGQQTILLFDGIRLNNSTYRQGPNQHLFTVDVATVHSVEVLRGGASTLFGSDALGGAILARPLEPDRDAQGVAPSFWLRGRTADGEAAARAQVEAGWGPLRALAGAGARRVGLLEGGGRLRGVDGELALVPRYDADGRTQLGTGFDEVTGDLRAVLPIGAGQLTLASYGYFQRDAPRTDQCPPPEAPATECLTFERQVRVLTYAAWESSLGAAAKSARVTFSWQRQHERRLLDRPGSFYWQRGTDDVDTLGLTASAVTRAARPIEGLRLQLEYGADAYVDRVASRSFEALTNVGVVQRESRGQYLDGSRYATLGAWTQVEAALGGLRAHAGGRAGWVGAWADADPASGSASVDRGWTPLAGNAGVAWVTSAALSLHANVDRSFRAPNLDDLTSRQQTGPGFQFENSALRPERAVTVELGARLDAPVRAQAWVYRMTISDGIERAPRTLGDCPPGTPQCAASRARFQLVNLDGASVIHGAEGQLEADLPWGLAARGAISYARSEGPNPGEGEPDRLPRSRTPPLNGTGELTWRHGRGWFVSSGVRWATAQTRLALADRSDARIPLGGTPGFVVVDAGGGFRAPDGATDLWVRVNNLGDAVYRYHGSSVNGAARELVVMLAVDL